MFRFASFIVALSFAFAQQTQRGVVLPAPPPIAAAVGSYYALIIGINDYPALPKLQTAVSDATSMDTSLRTNYSFRTQLLLDREATHDAIIDALSRYRQILGSNDNFLIYYAGHGHKDKDANRTYWLPVDSGDTPAHWISDQQIADSIRPLSARHILLISDSCYSGGLSLQRDAGDLGGNRADHETYVRRKLSLKSRTVISSGGDEPVADSGQGGHSVFTGAVLRGLTELEGAAFTAENLFQGIQERVVGASQQTPQFAPMRDTGHDAGDFVFLPAAGSDPGSRGPGARAPAPGSRSDIQPDVNRLSSGPPSQPRVTPLPQSFFGYRQPNSDLCVRIIFSRSEFPPSATGPALDSYFRDYLQATQRSSAGCSALQDLRLIATVQDNVPCGATVGMRVDIRYVFEGAPEGNHPGSAAPGIACYGNDPAQTEKLATDKAISNLRDAIAILPSR